jgi:hypothetical protein
MQKFNIKGNEPKHVMPDTAKGVPDRTRPLGNSEELVSARSGANIKGSKYVSP